MPDPLIPMSDRPRWEADEVFDPTPAPAVVSAPNPCPTCGRGEPPTCGRCGTPLAHTTAGWGRMLRHRRTGEWRLYGFTCGCYRRWQQIRELYEYEATGVPS